MEFTGTLNQEEFNDMCNLFNEAVKAHGLLGDYDIKARNLIIKFTPAPKTKEQEIFKT